MIPNDLTRYVLAHVVMRHYDARHPVVADDLSGQSRSAIPGTPRFLERSKVLLTVEKRA